MAFIVPSFPLNYGYKIDGAVGVGYDRYGVCNLTWGKRVQTGAQDMALLAGVSALQGMMTALFPPGALINDVAALGSMPSIEIPIGTGRWYYVLYVDDIGKGFPNEHRAAIITKVNIQAPFWPDPMP